MIRKEAKKVVNYFKHLKIRIEVSGPIQLPAPNSELDYEAREPWFQERVLQTDRYENDQKVSKHKRNSPHSELPRRDHIQ